MSESAIVTKAVYSWSVADGVICIVDEDGPRSVTNDAEAVIADLVRKGADLASMPVIYRDTEGIWDQLVAEDGQFVDFHLLGEQDRDRAIERAKEHKHSFGLPISDKSVPKASLVLQWAAEMLDRAEGERRVWAEAKPDWRDVYEGVAQQIKDRASQVRSWAAGAKWREDRGEAATPEHITYIRQATRSFLPVGGYPEAVESCRIGEAAPIGSLDELKATAVMWALLDAPEDTRHPDDAARLRQNVEAACTASRRWVAENAGSLSEDAGSCVAIIEAARGELDAATALHSQTPRWQRRFERVSVDLAAAAQPRSEELALTVCRSAAGYYLGTLTTDGLPHSRESAGYWDRKEDAEAAFAGRAPWTPRNAVEHFPPAATDNFTRHLSALRGSGTDEDAFGTALSQLTADLSVTADAAARLACAYTGREVQADTREAALGAIEEEFYAQRAANVQQLAAQSAGRGGGR